MNSLYMDRELAIDTLRKMCSKHDEMLQDLDELNFSLEGLKPCWVGSTASKFFGKYDYWFSAISGMLNEFHALRSDLQKEINEWQQDPPEY